MSSSAQPSRPLVARRKPGSYTGIPGQLFPARVPLKSLFRVVKRVASHCHLHGPHPSGKGPAAAAADGMPRTVLLPLGGPAQAASSHPPPPPSIRDFDPTSATTGAFFAVYSTPPSVVVFKSPDYVGGEALTRHDSGYEESTTSLDSEPSARAVYIGSEAPEPFLIDEDSDSDSYSYSDEATSTAQSTAATDDVLLAPTLTPASPNTLVKISQSPPPDRNEEVLPPLPPSDSEEEEALQYLPDYTEQVLPPLPPSDSKEEEALQVYQDLPALLDCTEVFPPLPPSDSDEEEALEVYLPALPALCIPTMFLPILNVRASSPMLMWWLRRTSV
ncbi:hypothetical protein C8R47DRAFT_502528 [Mycena vitilis]|nr:hypothetical protein C8R47DRAFT_502528 [Mycena vitilis]